MKTGKGEGRNLTDDILKIICAVLIVSAHTNVYVQNTIFNSIWHIVQTFGVTFFFFISGKYNLSDRLVQEGKFGEYYKKRVFTLLIPYILFLLACVVVEKNRTGDSLPQIISGIAITHTRNPYFHLWFMDIIIILMIATPFLAAMLKTLSDRQTVFGVALLILYMVASSVVKETSTVNVTDSSLFVCPAIAYIMGFYYNKKNDHVNRLALYLFGIMSFSLLIVLNIKKSWAADDFNIRSILYLFVISALYMFISKDKRTRRNCRIITLLSKATYGVYLIHPLMYNYVTYPRVKGSKETAILFSFLLTVAVSFAISVVFTIPYQIIIGKPEKSEK